ncbi:MAG: hypothetical protein L6437_00055 [Kiritimatiellae bacterium]|nr:hypothetical protein [Kiritimatiellia bacterium]
MKSKYLLFLAIAAVAYGDDITTLDGTVYKAAKVTRTTPSTLTIMHKAGVVTVPFSNLPNDIREKYGYDPSKAEAYARQKVEGALLARIKVDMKKISHTVAAELSQVLENGSLAYVTEYQTVISTNIITESSSGGYKTHTDLTGRRYVIRSGSHGSHVRAEVQKNIRQSKWDEPVFIQGVSRGYVDGDTWTGRIYPIGTYSYTTTIGAPKKIRRYTTDSTEAFEFHYGK